MGDIVDRLRGIRGMSGDVFPFCEEAADEIERLRAELAECQEARMKLSDDLAFLKHADADEVLECKQERDKLRELWFSDADPAETEYADQYAALKEGS